MGRLRIIGFFVLIVLTINACGDKKNYSKEYNSNGMEIYLHVDLKQYAPFSHVCKLSDGKRYFAVLGTYKGTAFINYTDSRLESNDIQFFSGAQSYWRECRSYRHANGHIYAYVITEGDSWKLVNGKPDSGGYPGGIQIFKLGKDKVEFVRTYIGNFDSAHTIFIDHDRGLAFVNGSRKQDQIINEPQNHANHLGSMRILDIATDPENPQDLGGYNGSYTHDSYALGYVTIPPGFKYDSIARKYIETPERKDYILYAADIFKGSLNVLSVLDPKNPLLLNSLSTPIGSTHNIWASDNKKWLFVTEETFGSSLLVYDISSPDMPRFVAAYRSENVLDKSMIHNVVVRGNIAYCSWYHEGLRLIDISNPVHPKEVAFFDSSNIKFSEKDPAHGNWSVDVDDRGLVMISDIDIGLFVLRRTN